MLLQQLLNLHENDDEDDDNSALYAREREVSLTILRVFRKCGIPVSEHNSKHSGVKDDGDYWGFDVLYSEDDFEGTVKVDEATSSAVAKLHESGLLKGDAVLTPSGDYIRFTFTVDKNVASGKAKMN